MPGRRFRAAALRAPLLAIVVAAFGCGANDAEPDPLPMTRLAQAETAPVWPEGAYVVRSEPEWAMLWHAHRAMGESAEPRPAIDFSTRMVLGLSLGYGPNGCHVLEIERVTQTRDALTVHYFYDPQAGSGDACTLALARLNRFVVVPAIPKPVQFRAVAPGSASGMLTGRWGDDALSVLTADDRSLSADVDCRRFSASQPLRIDEQGRFAVTGRLLDAGNRPHGSPRLDSERAELSGRVVGDALWLVVTVPESAAILGPVRLRRDGERRAAC